MWMLFSGCHAAEKEKESSGEGSPISECKQPQAQLLSSITALSAAPPYMWIRCRKCPFCKRGKSLFVCLDCELCRGAVCPWTKSLIALQLFWGWVFCFRLFVLGFLACILYLPLIPNSHFNTQTLPAITTLLVRRFGWPIHLVALMHLPNVELIKISSLNK